MMKENEQIYHVPVLLEQSIEGLNIQPAGTYVDVTFGGGGHSKEILKHLDKDGDRHVEGEIIFKWIFYAAVDEDFTPPDTGLLSIKNSFWLWCIAVSGSLVAVMALLLLIKKRKDKKEEL